MMETPQKSDQKLLAIEALKESSFKVAVESVQADKQIPIEKFLEASEGLTKIFDVLSTAFAMIKNDILNNVNKLRTRQQKEREIYEDRKKRNVLKGYTISTSLQALCLNELNDKEHKSHTATEGLLWLTRTLEFTCSALGLDLGLCHVEKDNKINWGPQAEGQKKEGEELVVSFRGSYQCTLSKHHNFFVRSSIPVAMSACPSRDTFYAKLAGKSPEKTAKEDEKLTKDDVTKVKEQLSESTLAMKELVDILQRFLETEGKF